MDLHARPHPTSRAQVCLDGQSGDNRPVPPPQPYDIVDLVERPDRDFEAFFDPAEFETRAWLEDQHYWHLYRRQVVLDVLRAAGVGPSQALLELGCGAGTVATFLNQHGLRVDYSDVHGEALRFAVARAGARLDPTAPPPRFFRADITERLPPGRYEGVLLLDVLEHLPDDSAVMRAVRERLGERLTAPTGDGPRPLVLFTVPAFPGLWSAWDDLEKHKRRFTLAGARALAEGAGFEVERSTYFFFPLFFAAAAVKALRAVREALLGPPPAPRFAAMAESRNHPALNAAMLTLLRAERSWLRDRDLPLGTSILVLARPAPV
jgi:SAM-dependent methyltransferase